MPVLWAGISDASTHLIVSITILYNVLDMAKETPKKKKNTPTSRQQKVFNEIVENRGSMKQAMIKAGYSPKYAKNPKQFRETASWQELLEENLPDWLLTEKHLELINDKDKSVALRAVQEAYKIKNRYEPEEVHFVRKYKDLSDEELEEEIQKLRKDAK